MLRSMAAKRQSAETTMWVSMTINHRPISVWLAVCALACLLVTTGHGQAAPGRYVTGTASAPNEPPDSPHDESKRQNTEIGANGLPVEERQNNNTTAQRYVEEGHAPNARTSNHLFLRATQARVRAGDEAVLLARADNDCHLTLINVDTDGQATVLFPNDLNTNNLLKADQEIQIPAADAGYRLTFDTVGTETFVGICLSDDIKTPPGIKHKFAAQRFTALGSWSEHLKKAEAAEKDWRKPRRKKLRRKKKARKKKGRRRKSRGWIYTTVARPPLRQVRATVKVVVEP